MKKYLSAIALCCLSIASMAQGLTLPPSGGNQKSSVTQYIGPVTVTINYSSPDVHAPNGEDRKGRIWGGIVHYGFIDQGFGTSKAAPWRAGANENTTISFSHNVKVNGKELAAGTYGLFLDVEKEGAWNWIFSKNSKSWGSYFYDPKEDALRVETTPQESPYTEFLTYNFEDRQADYTTAALAWENKKVPLRIEVPNINEIYVSMMREELRGDIGFDYQNLMSAANFCAQNKINLEEALFWADRAITEPFFGRQLFDTYATKARVLSAMGKSDEAEQVMNLAINHPTATVQAIHQYGRSLLQEGKKEKALEVFKLNRQKNPNDKFTTYVGLARGYTAIGDKKNAIKNWETAIKNLPEEQKGNLAVYEGELKKLKG